VAAPLLPYFSVVPHGRQGSHAPSQPSHRINMKLISTQAPELRAFRTKRNAMIDAMKAAYPLRDQPTPPLEHYRTAFLSAHAAYAILKAHPEFVPDHVSNDEAASLKKCLPVCRKDYCRALQKVIPRPRFEFLTSVVGWRRERGWNKDQTAVIETVHALEQVQVHLVFKTDDDLRAIYGSDTSLVPHPVRAAILFCLNQQAGRADVETLVSNGKAAVDQWLAHMLALHPPGRTFTTLES